MSQASSWVFDSQGIIAITLQDRGCTSQMRKIRFMGRKPGSTLLLCLFSPSLSSGIPHPSAILHTLHYSQLAFKSLPIPWPSVISLLHTKDLLALPFSNCQLIPTVIHNPHQYNHSPSAHHVLGIEFGALHISFHSISIRTLK